MKVTLSFLKKENACQSGIEVFKKVFNNSAELKDIINFAIDKNKKELLQHANWLIVRKMTHRQKIQYAVFAAEQVLHIFEKKYPEDKRPRQAIEAAKLVLKKNNKENRKAAAAYASAVDAAAAANAAANAASYAAAAASYAAAANAANAASASYASYAAAAASYAAAADKWNKMQINILKNGLKIIYKEK